MTSIPDTDYAAMFDLLGHTLSEYDGLAEALYAHEQARTKEAAPAMERPLFKSGVSMSSGAKRWGVVDRSVGFRALYKPPANAA